MTVATFARIPLISQTKTNIFSRTPGHRQSKVEEAIVTDRHLIHHSTFSRETKKENNLKR